MKLNQLSIAAAAGAIALAGWAAPSDAQYYKDKTISIIVGFNAGGTDQTARVFAQILP